MSKGGEFSEIRETLVLMQRNFLGVRADGLMRHCEMFVGAAAAIHMNS